MNIKLINKVNNNKSYILLTNDDVNYKSNNEMQKTHYQINEGNKWPYTHKNTKESKYKYSFK